MQHTDGLLGNEVEAALVVCKVNLGPVNVLLVVNRLLQLENVPLGNDKVGSREGSVYEKSGWVSASVVAYRMFL